MFTRGPAVREWPLKRGDAVVLTHDSSRSFHTGDTKLAPDERIVGIVLDRLGADEDDEAVWGVLVNGEFHQVLNSEIESVMPGEA